MANCFSGGGFKKPSNTICLVVVMLLILVVSCCAFFYVEANRLIEQLNTVEGNVVSSEYVSFSIIENEETYTIYRDDTTDILYIELKRNGYSSALTILFNEDGTPKKYGQYNNG